MNEPTYRAAAAHLSRAHSALKHALRDHDDAAAGQTSDTDAHDSAQRTIDHLIDYQRTLAADHRTPHPSTAARAGLTDDEIGRAIQQAREASSKLTNAEAHALDAQRNLEKAQEEWHAAHQRATQARTQVAAQQETRK